MDGTGSVFLGLIGFAVFFWAVSKSSNPKQAEGFPPEAEPQSNAELQKRLTEVVGWVSRFERRCDDEIANHRWLNREFRAKWNKSKPKGKFPSDEEIARLEQEKVRLLSKISGLREIWELGVERHCARLNALLMSAEREEMKAFFRSVEKSPLTDEQVDASICFENRVNVVAAAGSGKTSVMVAKAGYAIHRGLVEPERVLLLAFNKEAVVELRQRIDRYLSKFGIETSKIEVSTFHAFGLRMIGEISGKKPRVAEWATTRPNEIAKAAEIISRLCSIDKTFSLNWVLLKTIFISDLANFGDEETSDYWDPETRKTGKRTLNNEVVKSDEERLIADWLYLHGVSYQYERDYEIDTRTPQNSQYRPDFFYPEIDVYHEHFALGSDGEPPAKFKGYMQGVLWKRAKHKEFGTKLFQTTSAEIRSRSPFERLEKMFAENGLELKFDPDRPFIGRTPIDDRLIINNLLTFLSHAKNGRLSIPEIRSKLGKEKSDSWSRHSLFVDVFEKFYSEWQAELQSGGCIDFHDMLCQAGDLLGTSNARKEYDLVLVDEFQDSSVSRMQLVRALAERPGVQVTVVGDDWQSINRFAGADVTIATKFGEYFGESLEFQLTRTFRCPSEICDISSNFVMRNGQQIKKKVLGNPNTRDAHVLISFVPNGESSEKKSELRIDALNSVLERIALDKSRKGSEVLVLGRYKFEIKDMPLPNEVTQVLSVRKSTIHGSKGTEADHVVVVGMDSDNKYGFPSAVDDDPVLGLVMPKADALEFAEERRLFYVALTRAKETVHLLGNASTPSRFLAEIAKSFSVPTISGGKIVTANRHCPKCNGLLVKKTNRDTKVEFLSCQQFPKCRYSESIQESRAVPSPPEPPPVKSAQAIDPWLSEPSIPTDSPYDAPF